MQEADQVLNIYWKRETGVPHVPWTDTQWRQHRSALTGLLESLMLGN